MNSNFIEFIDNKIDFIKNNDLLVLIDKDKLTEEEQNSLASKEINYLVLSKDIVGTNRHKDNFKPIEGVVNYILTYYNTKYNYFLVDRFTKIILINTEEILSKLKISDLKLNNKIKDNKLFVSELEGYKVITFNDIKKDIDDLIEEVNLKMINQNYNELYGRGKEEIYNMESYLESSKKDIVTNYIKDKPFNKSLINFIIELNSSKFYKYENNRSLMIEYLRDNDRFINDLEDEFNKTISNTSNQVNYLCENFFKNEKYQELINELLPEIRLNEEINAKRNIIRNLEYGGKTVTVNGIKVENRICCYNGRFEMNGIKGMSINLDDVYEIKYGKKILYKRALTDNAKAI